MTQDSVEGTWEEIAQQAWKFAGRRVRLTILDGADDPEGAGESLPGEQQALSGRFVISSSDDEQLEATTQPHPPQDGRMYYGMFKGEKEPAGEDFRSAEFHGD